MVAADDGIMPQTVEALNHAQAANVPIVVAVNKVDKPDANPSKVRQQLTEYGLVAEEFGGDVMFVDVSARANTGIQDLLDAVLLTADAGLDLTANPNKAARGVAIEAKLDKGRGSVATVLIQSGTLRVGDAIVAGTAYGRVRAMADENGEQVLEAYPSRPVQVQGLNSVPRAGDVFIVTEEDRMARQIAEKREAVERNAQLAKARKRISLEDFTRALEEGKVESLNLIIKGDVSGAVEALEESLLKIEVDDSVQLRIIHRGVGAITESDVNLATIDNAIIVGFNVRPDTKARERAAREGVDIRFYSVIYNAIDEIESSLKGMLKPEYEEVQSGVAEIREVFRSSKFGNIAGVIVRSERSPATPRLASSATASSSPMVSPSSRCVASRTMSPRSVRTTRPVSDSGSTTTSRSVTRSRRPSSSRSLAADLFETLSGVPRLPVPSGSWETGDALRVPGQGENNGRRTTGPTCGSNPRDPRGAAGEGAARSTPRLRHHHRRPCERRPPARVRVLHGARHGGGAHLQRSRVDLRDRHAAQRGRTTAEHTTRADARVHPGRAAGERRPHRCVAPRGAAARCGRREAGFFGFARRRRRPLPHGRQLGVRAV